MSRQGASHLQVHPLVWCLPENSSGWSCHDQQDTKGAIDDVLTDLGQGGLFTDGAPTSKSPSQSTLEDGRE